jgi:hypothetical protein
MQYSLADYYPPDTVYFHSAPARKNSGFFNGMDAWVDALAAGRMLTCAGDKMKIVLFGAAFTPDVLRLLRDDLKVPIQRQENILFLPESITSDIQGEERDALIKNSLKKSVPQGKLIISQPYFDPDFNDIYQIPVETIDHLNDKANLGDYVPAEFLPKRYCEFENGKSFAENVSKFTIPCVVKVAYSSGGDGVRICKTFGAFSEAKKAFRNLDGKIVVEQFIDAAHNIGVHLAVPFQRNKPMQVIGSNEQITTDSGGYLGGIVNLSKTWPQMKDIRNLLLKRILPAIREKGWYGVGGVDILIGKDGGIYVIDFNFRLTAPMPYLFQTKNGDITKPIITFTGAFNGDEGSFKKMIVPLAKMGSKSQILDIVSLIKYKDSYRFNCGMLFDDEASIAKNAEALLNAGVCADVLERFAGR